MNNSNAKVSVIKLSYNAANFIHGLFTVDDLHFIVPPQQNPRTNKKLNKIILNKVRLFAERPDFSNSQNLIWNIPFEFSKIHKDYIFKVLNDYDYDYWERSMVDILKKIFY